MNLPIDIQTGRATLLREGQVVFLFGITSWQDDPTGFYEEEISGLYELLHYHDSLDGRAFWIVKPVRGPEQRCEYACDCGLCCSSEDCLDKPLRERCAPCHIDWSSKAVEANKICAQVDPKGYGEYLLSEREMRFELEDQIRNSEGEVF